MNTRRIYITGASGCIGSQVTPLIPDAISIEGNILTTDFTEILEPNSTLIHLAARSNIAESKQKPEEYHEINVEGLKRVADACLAKNVKILFTSTVHVYGCPGPLIRETCPTLTAYSPYGATKIAGEHYLHDLGKKGLKYTIFRWPGVFGYSPRMHFDTALNQFTLQAVQGRPLTVWQETLHQKRPHLYIGDAVGAIKFFVERDLFDNEIYNVISGNFTVEETINAIREFVPDLAVSLIPAPAMNPLLDIDDSKIRAMGFKPTGTLRKGIAEMIPHIPSL
jgi:nucleoside-diphosphate-sugar epimerase